MTTLTRMAGFIADNLIPVACAAIILTALGWALAEFFTAPEDNEADVSRLDEWDAREAEATCGHSNGSLVCNRARGHASDWHADWMQDTARPIKWRDGELGMRSLDEIRRAYGGGSDAA